VYFGVGLIRGWWLLGKQGAAKTAMQTTSHSSFRFTYHTNIQVCVVRCQPASEVRVVRLMAVAAPSA
jgi:hypothetical protein